MLMKAWQVVRPRSFGRVDIPIPEIPHDSKDLVLVRTSWAMTCGSDIPFFTGNKRYRNYPLAPGAPIHECVGEVVKSSSDRFRPGQQVLAIPDGDLGLAEFFLAQASKTILLKPEAGDPAAACIIQPLSTVINAMDRLGDIRGKSVAVMGLGSIGQMFCWLAKVNGAASVVGIDPVEHRCRFARSMGARETVSRRGIELVHDVRAVPDEWNPPDIVIEAVGHQMNTINDCLELVRKYGTVVAFGVPDNPVYTFEYEIFFRKNILLLGTVTPDWSKYLTKAQDLYLAHREELSRLVTHRLPMRETESAYGLYERHEDGIIKAVLDASAW